MSQGGGFKTICKVMGPEMKKEKNLRDLFQLYYLPSISCLFVCLIIFLPIFYQDILNLSTDFDFLGQEAPN